MGSFPDMYNDPFCSCMTGKSYAGHPEFHRIREPTSLSFFLLCNLAGCTLLLNFLLIFFQQEVVLRRWIPKRAREPDKDRT